VIFVLAPLSILTGPSMSPALVNRFSWYRKLPGNRQIGRSIHFLLLCAYVLFVIAHVSMVLLTGFARNMNHIVIGTDDLVRFGMYIGLSGLVILFLLNVMANWATWLFPRAIQRVGDAGVNPSCGSCSRGTPRGPSTRSKTSRRSCGPTENCRPRTNGKPWPRAASRITV